MTDVKEDWHIVRKMFVGGLNIDTETDTLTSYFSKYGTVVHAVVLKDARTNKSRKCGFVTYSSVEEVDEAMSNRPHMIDGVVVDAKRAMSAQNMRMPGSQEKVTKIFVGGLGREITSPHLREYFESYGAVLEAFVMKDAKTGNSRGFGFVSFNDHDCVDKCTQQRYHMINNKQVEVKKVWTEHQQKKMGGGRDRHGMPSNMPPPHMLGMQGMQGMQGMSGMQGMQGMQGVSGMPGMFGPPGFQGMPPPRMPGMSAMPRAQGMKGPPGMSGMPPPPLPPPNMPGMPSGPALPGVNGMQALQALQVLQAVQTLQGLLMPNTQASASALAAAAAAMPAMSITNAMGLANTLGAGMTNPGAGPNSAAGSSYDPKMMGTMSGHGRDSFNGGGNSGNGAENPYSGSYNNYGDMSAYGGGTTEQGFLVGKVGGGGGGSGGVHGASRLYRNMQDEREDWQPSSSNELARSDVWSHFQLLGTGVRCCLCSVKLQYKGDSLPAMIYHLQSRHPQALEDKHYSKRESRDGDWDNRRDDLRYY